MAGAASRMGTPLPSRLRQWALRRQGKDPLPVLLTPRRVYILPTPAGWTFGLLIAVVFIAGMNYGNGLALLFSFWLAGFAFVAMVQTQRTLAGTQLHAASAEPVFAGEQVAWRIRASSRTALGNLRLDTQGGIALEQQAPGGEGNEGDLRFTLLAQRRGRMRLPVLRITSTAPFGLFRTWTWLDIGAQVLVFPRPAGQLPVPEAPGHDHGSTQVAHGQDELAWLRDFREGDSPRQIAWKAYARGAPLLVREYRGTAARRREFDFDALAGLDTEARLSQLARWIIDAAARGESWLLRLPGAEPLEGGGTEHLAHCLGLLAMHGQAGQPP
jgi:uncharacterized protein (DUF58 family)